MNSVDRRAKILFRYYSQRAAYGAKERAIKANVQCTINAEFIEQLLERQKWCCAISGIKLIPRSNKKIKGDLDPFGPSIDRIVPSLGYIPENVRAVCNIVNAAMNQWGLETLRKVIKAIQEVAPQPPPVPSKERISISMDNLHRWVECVACDGEGLTQGVLHEQVCPKCDGSGGQIVIAADQHPSISQSCD